MTVRVLPGHALEVLAGLAPRSVHVCVTSPPYWGLRAYQTAPQKWGDGWTGELGSEPTLDGFVAHLVEVFAAVRRVLRDDGTLWVNLGDSYASKPTGHTTPRAEQRNGSGVFRIPPQHHIGARWDASREKPAYEKSGLKDGDLCMAPARFALAMQASGWTLRSEITLCKMSPMPESVQGARWERCRVKAVYRQDVRDGTIAGRASDGAAIHFDHRTPQGSEWEDCPGCPKCSGTEGYVQRWGSGRPTSATEKLYVFAKAGKRYFYDLEACRVRFADERLGASGAKSLPYSEGAGRNDTLGGEGRRGLGVPPLSSGRNAWNWRLWSPEPLKESHYAAYPRWLPRLAIQAGTSEAGCCPGCGAPFLRVVERASSGRVGPTGSGWRETEALRGDYDAVTRVGEGQSTTLGWRQSCRCPAHQPAPCTVLDPFSGSGTTVIEANALGRHGVGVELQEKYVDIAHRRLSGQPVSLFAWEAPEAPVDAR